MKDYLLSEAAELLELSSGDVLRTQIRRGKLRAYKRGRDWFVKPAEIERYRRENRGKHQRSGDGR